MKNQALEAQRVSNEEWDNLYMCPLCFELLAYSGECPKCGQKYIVEAEKGGSEV